MAARIVDTAELREPLGSQEDEVRPAVCCGVCGLRFRFQGWLNHAVPCLYQHVYISDYYVFLFDCLGVCVWWSAGERDRLTRSLATLLCARLLIDCCSEEQPRLPRIMSAASMVSRAAHQRATNRPFHTTTEVLTIWWKSRDCYVMLQTQVPAVV